jgi:hypothetical protein
MGRFHEIDAKSKLWVHRVADKDNETHIGVGDRGRVIYSEADLRLYAGSNSTWVLVSTPYDILPQNTKLLMGSWPLPTGWNLDITYDDIMILVSQTEGDVDNTDGNWTISSINTADEHDHTTGYPTVSMVIGGSDIYATAPSNTHTHNISDDGDHFHFFNGNWRPSHTKYAVVQYT